MEGRGKFVSVWALILFVGPSVVRFSGVDATMCGCPPLWTGFDSNCYRYFSSENMTQFDAEQACQTFTSPGFIGHLVSIHSQDEMDLISVMYETLRSKRPGRDTWVWIGLHNRALEDSTYWTDGTQFDYSNWKPGQPSDRGGASNCVFFSKDQLYKWNDIGCGVSSLVEAYICKIRQW
ncbi:echinoidin-like [Lytechinus variegatus]|uniref:echinoidin-like n=1 Tax=Lytechinus variegatus TaxID=7654 RepID=UPI001BB2733F|nr:echinoidin-like [Lytechinus variegatus]